MAPADETAAAELVATPTTGRGAPQLAAPPTATRTATPTAASSVAGAADAAPVILWTAAAAPTSAGHDKAGFHSSGADGATAPGCAVSAGSSARRQMRSPLSMPFRSQPRIRFVGNGP